VGSLDFYVLDSVLKPIACVELPKEVFTSRARWMPLIVKWNASANMFYLLKNILLLILVIFKLKCNNLILNEIMVLNASYMCLYAFSLHRESPDPDPERWTRHFWGGSITPSALVNTDCLHHQLRPPHAASTIISSDHDRLQHRYPHTCTASPITLVASAWTHALVTKFKTTPPEACAAQKLKQLVTHPSD
jgi:hypothetical protein